MNHPFPYRTMVTKESIICSVYQENKVQLFINVIMFIIINKKESNIQFAFVIKKINSIIVQLSHKQEEKNYNPENSFVV